MTTWLSKQKKNELLELADEAGLKGVSSMNKGDIIESLEKHLRANAAALAKKARFDSFYNTARANSPIKREPAATDSPDVEVKKAAPKRRTTTVGTAAAVSSSSSTAPSATQIASTPSSVARMARAIPLPSSPQAVTDLVERQSALLTTYTDKLLDATHANELALALRDSLSSVHGITTLFVLLEAFALSRVTLPWRHAFSVPIPFNDLLGLASPMPVSFPDLFVLLTAAFWSPTMLWLGVAVIGPLLTGWLFNLSRAAAAPHGRRSVSRQPPVDPVAFNIARGLGAWLVFVNKYNAMGYIDYRSAGLVEAALWGGSTAVMVTSAIATVAGLYEAVLRKQ